MSEPRRNRYAPGLDFPDPLPSAPFPGRSFFMAGFHFLTIPESGLPAHDEMRAADFHPMTATGPERAKANDSYDVDEVLEEPEAGPES